MRSQIRVHILGAMEKGNVGTLVAQRALIKLLKKWGFDISVSISNKNVFTNFHQEFEENEIYDTITFKIGRNLPPSHFKWVVFTFLKLLLLNLLAIFYSFCKRVPFKSELSYRINRCDILLDLNLEMLRGIPISISQKLIERSPRIILFHKIFWSLRIFLSLWFLFLIKGIFKKEIIVGPASFGPFRGLPYFIRLLTKFILANFIDLILVREPLSAKFLDDIGVKNYIVVSDIALLDVKQPELVNSSCDSKLTIGFAPAFIRYTLTKDEYENYVKAHGKIIDFLIDSYGCEIIILPSSMDDLIAVKKILFSVRNRDKVKVMVSNDVDLYESTIRKLSLLVTSRMHPSIIAARNFIPFCSIIYDHKQVGFLKQISLLYYSMLINEVTYENLKMLVIRSLQDKQKIKEKIEKNLPKVKQLSETIINKALKTLTSS